MNSSLDRERRRKGSVEWHMLIMGVEEVRKPSVQLALDAIGRVWGVRQDTRLYQKHEIWPERHPDPLSDIEGLHPLLGESKQHVQGGVT